MEAATISGTPTVSAAVTLTPKNQFNVKRIEQRSADAVPATAPATTTMLSRIVEKPNQVCFFVSENLLISIPTNIVFMRTRVGTCVTLHTREAQVFILEKARKIQYANAARSVRLAWFMNRNCWNAHSFTWRLHNPSWIRRLQGFGHFICCFVSELRPALSKPANTFVHTTHRFLRVPCWFRLWF